MWALLPEAGHGVLLKVTPLWDTNPTCRKAPWKPLMRAVQSRGAATSPASCPIALRLNSKGVSHRQMAASPDKSIRSKLNVEGCFLPNSYFQK